MSGFVGVYTWPSPGLKALLQTVIHSAEDLIVATEAHLYPGYSSRGRVDIEPFALLERNAALRECRVWQ